MSYVDVVKNKRLTSYCKEAVMTNVITTHLKDNDKHDCLYQKRLWEF